MRKTKITEKNRAARFGKAGVTAIALALFCALIFAGGCGGGGGSSSNGQSQTPAVPEEKEVSEAVATMNAYGGARPSTENGDGYFRTENNNGEKSDWQLTASASDSLYASATEIIVPGSVTYIGSHAFKDTPNVKSIRVTGTPEIAPEAFADCPQLEYVKIGIGECRTLKEFKQFIKDYSKASFHIGDRAFANCPKLKTVDFGCVAPPTVGSDIFGGRKVTLLAPYIYPEEYKKAFSNVETTGKTWMTDLPDAIRINQISIPGTHDTCTKGVDSAFVEQAQTQWLWTGEQWDCGVRAMDLRPIHYSKYSDMRIYHGGIGCNMDFDDALDIIRNKLRAMPNDTAVIIINHETSSPSDLCQILPTSFWKGNKAIQDQLGEFDDISVKYHKGLTLGEMRGKALFLSRDPESDIEPHGAYAYGFNKKNNKIGTSETDPSKYETLWVQDKDNPDGKDDKRAALKEYFDDFSNAADGNPNCEIWCFNHTSGYIGSPPFPINYPDNAENVNGWAADYIKDSIKGPAGIVMMDFAGTHTRKRFNTDYTVYGDTLVNATIEHNYR